MAAERGTVASLWRYPVKSMRGEDLPTVEVTEPGLLGDRAYALIDGAGQLDAIGTNLLKTSGAFIPEPGILRPTHACY